MNRIPFSVYDFFGYLSAGFLLLAAADYSFDGGWLLTENLGLVFGILWTVVAYILGHIVASLSSFLLEWKMVRGALDPPEETLFWDKAETRWARVFPGYYRPLPKDTRKRVLAKAKEKSGPEAPGRAHFLHCHSIVKREQAILERLNSFLNLYGFCRNMSTAALLAVPVLLIGGKWLWALLATVAAVAMFHRYLRFFRHYTVEVFVSYSEVN